jgi:general secretion pathway protein K
MIKPDQQKGTALIAALLLVALMAAVSIQLIDLTRFSLFRSAQIDARTQALWYARGTRDLGEQLVIMSGEPSREVMRSDEIWNTGQQILPIDGGEVLGVVRDGNNCININALSGRESEDLELAATNEENRQFIANMITTIADEMELPPGIAERLNRQMIDWIDGDARPEPGGAEDSVYAGRKTPFRAANQRFFELEELLVLPDMTPEIYRLMRPWLCVRPEMQQPSINLNTLGTDQALLLTALFHGRLAVSDAEAILFRRPVTGYDSIDEFWSDPLIARFEDSQTLRERTTLRTRWFEMEMSVRLNGAEFQFSQLAEFSETGGFTRHANRFGVF